MKLRKLNHSPWLLLGLAAVMLAGCLVMATGTTLARYRVTEKETVALQARPLEQIYLGQMVRDQEEPDKRTFDGKLQGTWLLVDGVTRLDIALANGIITQEEVTEEDGTKILKDVEAFAQEDQRALVQVVGNLTVWDGKSEIPLILKAPSRTEAGEFEEIRASAQRIDPDSLLYKTFGDGWIFTFPDEDGRELSWYLEGGKLSVVELTLIYAGELPGNAGLLKLQVTGDYTKK